MARKTILLVDDDTMVLNCLGELLRRCGYTVMAEREASAALAEGATGARFDLVITDYKMAGLDGLEFLCRIRQMHPTMPAIVLTGYGSLENYQKAAGLGMTAYIQKPFKAREMMRIVACALGEAADARFPGASDWRDPDTYSDGAGDNSRCAAGRLSGLRVDDPTTTASTK